MSNDLGFWWEAAKILPSVVTALTAILGVTIAARGLTKWRGETIGKRQAELAEEILADFYEARDAIERIDFQLCNLLQVESERTAKAILKEQS
jgi:hypothetical protein